MKPSRMFSRRLEASVLCLLSLALLAAPVNGAIWPLAGYEACASKPQAVLSGPWADGSAPTPTGVALDSDNNVLWVVAEGTLHKYRFSDESLLSSYSLEAPAGGEGMAGRKMLSVFGSADSPNYSVTLSEVGQIAVSNGKDAMISILSSDPVTHEIFPVEEIELSFIPLSITYDAAFERFFATNALPSLSSVDMSSIPPGTEVVRIDKDGTEQLFVIDYTNLLSGNSITDIHYSSNTGTFFILCSECNGVFEVTKSGSLRSFTSSSFEIPDDPQPPTALSLARTGNVMLILRDKMVLDSYCQEFIPALPVLPNPGPYFTANQTWYPIDTYIFCGFSEYKEIDTDDVTDITLDPSTSTNWLLIGGKLREYDWTGNLLRELDEARLAELGLTGITAITFFKSRKLLLGFQTGNRLVVLDTAPVEYTPGDDEEEPPGPGGNAEFIQQSNLAVVLEDYTINDFTLPADSLGAIHYIGTQNAVLYSPVGQKSVFRADLGESGELVLVGQSVDIESLDDVIYSPIQNSYLVFSNSGSKLVQVNVKPEISEAEKSFSIGGNAAGMTMTPDGNIMIITTTSGNVNYFCGNGINSDGVITRSLDGEDPDVNPLYFWQLQQLQQAETGEIANVEDRSVPLDFTVPFSTLFGVTCGDPDYFVWPAAVTTSSSCEDKCQSLLACNAFTWDFTLSRCTLKTTCNIQQPSATSISGVKQTSFFAPPPAAASPPPPPPPPPTLVPGAFQLFPGTSCKDNTLGAPILGATSQMCQVICSSNPQCGAFTFNNGCFLKTSCTSLEIVPGASSGIKQGGAAQPIPVNSPPPPPPPVIVPPVGGYQYLPGIGCKDQSLGAKISNTNQINCELLCSTTPACTAYTLNTKNDCFLKATCNLQVPNFIDFSGIKLGSLPSVSPSPSPSPSPPAVVPGAWQILAQIGCKDPNLVPKIEGVSQQGCQDECEANAQCMAFTHNSKNDCFLKATCDAQEFVLNDVSGIKPTVDQFGLPLPLPPPAPPASVSVLSDSGAGASLLDGWEWDGDEDCEPWKEKCGLGANPGLKVGDVTWYRMFAHKANPMSNLGDGIMEWTPYREKKTFGYMYTKGSEIVGYFDEAIPVANEGDVASVTFLWASEGTIQDKICGEGLGSDIDCDECEDKYSDANGSEQYFYWEARCFSGTGDFRVALLDTSKGERITKDGYGYFNEKVTQYRGFQWRFHPQACPEVGRDELGPNGYAATAATSWWRNEIHDDWLNSQGLTCDFIEEDKNEDDWYSELGASRSFEDRLYKYNEEEGECLNLANGEFTPEDKPFKLTLTNMGPGEDNDSDDFDEPLIKFEWKMEFNGWERSQVDEVPASLFPSLIDGIAIGYTNTRYFKKLRLKHIG